MQCTRYLPGYHHPKDLNGNSWSIPHNDISWNNARGFYLPLPPFPVDQNMEAVHQKEILKQTILKHETIFRYQVNELHRVYRRQRELMDDAKRRKLVEDHYHLQALESKPFVPQLRSEISQKTHWPLVDLTGAEPSTLHKEMFLGSSKSVAGHMVQPGADMFSELNITKERKTSSSKSSTTRKRMLDLELPAEEYMDSEEGEQFEEESPVQGTNIQNSEPQPRYHSKLNSVNPEDSSIFNSSQRGNFLLFDLNDEPIQPDETQCPNLALESINICEEISNGEQDLSGTVLAECSILKKDVTGADIRNLNSLNEVSTVGKTVLACDETTSSPRRSIDKSHDGAKAEKSLLVVPRRKFEIIPFAVQALPCFITSASPSKSPKSSAGNSSLTEKKIDLYNSSTASSPTSGTSGSCLMRYVDNDHTSGQIDAVKVSKDMDLNCAPSSDLSDNQFSTHSSNCERSIVLDCISSPDSALDFTKSSQDNTPLVGDVNDSELLTTSKRNLSCIKEKTTSATTTIVERDLEAPISPENKESSPPRGDSQDKLSDDTGELDKAAAEALLFIQRHSKTAAPFEASHYSLGLLASIAATLASNPQNNIGKEKEAVCNSLHSWPRRSRRRSVNSQLNEDFLGIESPKSRGRQIQTLRRRASSRSRRCSLLQANPGDDKQGNTERFFKGWGVTKGRQNGRRARSYMWTLWKH